MWRDNHNYFLRLRIRVLGHNETVVLRHTEGRSCSWTSSTCWFRHWIAEQRRRCKCRYWVVSRGNASKVWKTICILCKILPFLGSSNYMFSLQISFGTLHWPSVSGYVDELIEALIEKKAPFVRWQLLCICDSTSLSHQILAHASPRAKLSEQLTERIKSSGLGMLTSWSPQQFILNHPVLFISLNSTCTCPELNNL